MNSRLGITEEESAACQMVLLELADVLAPWWDDIVVVGGVAIQLSLGDQAGAVLRTADLDLAMDIRTLTRLDVPEDIHTRLMVAGYEEPEPGGKAYRYFRRVTVLGASVRVPVDLLTAEKFGKRPDRYVEEAE